MYNLYITMHGTMNVEPKLCHYLKTDKGTFFVTSTILSEPHSVLNFMASLGNASHARNIISKDKDNNYRTI